MKLSTISVISAIAIFAATLPHGVGAWLIKTIPLKPIFLETTEVVPCSPEVRAKSIAKEKVYKTFSKNAKAEWQALAKLWGKESGWNYQANNPYSSAYGLAQVLNTPEGSTIQYQVNKGLEYIVHRYDKPTNAWAFWKKNGWY